MMRRTQGRRAQEKKTEIKTTRKTEKEDGKESARSRDIIFEETHLRGWGFSLWGIMYCHEGFFSFLFFLLIPPPNTQNLEIFLLQFGDIVAI